MSITDQEINRAWKKFDDSVNLKYIRNLKTKNGYDTVKYKIEQEIKDIKKEINLMKNSIYLEESNISSRECNKLSDTKKQEIKDINIELEKSIFSIERQINRFTKLSWFSKSKKRQNGKVIFS